MLAVEEYKKQSEEDCFFCNCRERKMNDMFNLCPEKPEKSSMASSFSVIQLFELDCRDGLPADIPEGGSAGCLFLPGHDLVRTFFII